MKKTSTKNSVFIYFIILSTRSLWLFLLSTLMIWALRRYGTYGYDDYLYCTTAMLTRARGYPPRRRAWCLNKILDKITLFCAGMYFEWYHPFITTTGPPREGAGAPSAVWRATQIPDGNLQMFVSTHKSGRLLYVANHNKSGPVPKQK